MRLLSTAVDRDHLDDCEFGRLAHEALDARAVAVLLHEGQGREEALGLQRE